MSRTVPREELIVIFGARRMRDARQKRKDIGVVGGGRDAPHPAKKKKYFARTHTHTQKTVPYLSLELSIRLAYLRFALGLSTRHCDKGEMLSHRKGRGYGSRRTIRVICTFGTGNQESEPRGPDRCCFKESMKRLRTKRCSVAFAFT